MIDNKPLLDAIEPDVVDRLVSRRQAIRQGATVSSGVVAALAIGSVPVALAALSRDVYGQGTPADVRGVLEFAYLLENLEYEFYNAVLSAAAFATVRATLSQTETATLTQIRKHEQAHVALLRGAINGLGGAQAPTYTAANFDFTGGNGSGTGPLAMATTDKAVLLAAAQSFEDTGVRAYKGQVGKLIGSAVLTTALQIHSVEARHAAKIRRMRGVTGWIVNADPGFTAPAGATAIVQRIYGGEENTTHAGRSFATAGDAGFGGVAAVTGAFDEPLTAEDVTFIVNPFIVGGA